MNRWIGKVAVVTGASSGIGLATSQYLVKEGMIVVGLARRKGKMEDEMKLFKGKGKFIAKECDVSNETQIAETFKWIHRTLGGVHVLINNAGLMTSSTMFEAKREVMSKIVNVNIMGLLYCTLEAVKIMKELGTEGHIININSIVGHRVLRNKELAFNVYPASKHAVTALTTTMEVELLGSKIRCTSVSPGLVKTEVFEANSSEEKNISGALDKLPNLLPEDVADSIVYILGTNPRVQITELTIRPLGEVF
ncbi:farnesol dehydrogenase-like [Leptopilina heterotoma]|uniref:farnesol dehydrogenase-like n=1 Tax=Leptopilina heterotoma TaxID=63436 RepID=UPI001CA9C33E|nr:farnesol dehydrogenase-like [Leptopilina heterotoma]